MQIYIKLRAEAKQALILPKRISICARSANIAKVECRGKIYFHSAETKRIYGRQDKYSRKSRAEAKFTLTMRDASVYMTISSNGERENFNWENHESQ